MRQILSSLPKVAVIATVMLGYFFLTISCKDKVKETESKPLAKDFVSLADPTNTLKITFASASVNATKYAWDFGDKSAISNDVNPSHLYSSGGTYNVTLTVSNDKGDTNSTTKAVVVVGPKAPVQASLLSGATATGKTWILRRDVVAVEFVNAGNSNNIDFCFGGTCANKSELNSRPCVTDDEYIFKPDGTFVRDTKGTFWMDGTYGGWKKSSGDRCADETTAGIFTTDDGKDYSALKNGGSFTFVHDTNKNTITISGKGAYIAFPSKTNSGDLGTRDGSDNVKTIELPASVTYSATLVDGGTKADTLKLEMVVTGGSIWRYFLVSYKNPADKPSLELPPVASFTSAIDPTNSKKVNFTNTSTNATTYSWNFGDNTALSVEKDPSHIYAQGGTFKVTLTVKNSKGVEHSVTNDVVVDGQVVLANLLTGVGVAGKTWSLRRDVVAVEFVNAGNSNRIDFCFGGTCTNKSELNSRPCVTDDEYIFKPDGTFVRDTKGTFWMDGVYGGWKKSSPDRCADETTAGIFTTDDGKDYSALQNGGNFTFVLDATKKTITISGKGAYIAFPSKTNAGDLGTRDGSDNVKTIELPASVTYSATLVDGGTKADTLKLELGVPGGSIWRYFLVSYKNPADKPSVELPTPVASFTSAIDPTDSKKVTFTNTSKNATTYSWNFGDNSPASTDNDPVHIYANFGTFTVMLTATGNGKTVTQSVEVKLTDPTQVVPLTAANFPNDNVIWKLEQAGDAAKVGNGPNSGSGWPTGGDIAKVFTERSCFFDDTFIFKSDVRRSLTIDRQNSTWVEAWQGFNPSQCADPSTSTKSNFSLLSQGDYTYEIIPATGDVPAKLKLSKGAYIGYPKVYNGGELIETDMVKENITYDVFSYVPPTATQDGKLILTIMAMGSDWWTTTLVGKMKN